jgi:hypothetical protein
MENEAKQTKYICEGNIRRNVGSKNIYLEGEGKAI